MYIAPSFGWQASPFIYNTLSGAVAQFLRRLGICNLFYLDDSTYLPLFGLAPGQPLLAQAHATVYVVCSILVWLGYFVHLTKSHLSPTSVLDWLGFTRNSGNRTFTIPSKKLTKFLVLLTTILAARSVSHKTLERFVGKCVSLRLAVPGAMLFTRHMYSALRHHPSSDVISLSYGELRHELQHWQTLPSWHGTQTWRSERHVTITIETDSSSRRWGGRIIVGQQEFRAGDDWTLADRTQHINILEIRAFYNVLLSFRSHLQNSHVDCFIDNRSALYNLINGGGRNLEMTEVAKLVFQLQNAANFDLQYHWISSSSANSVADAISREESPLRLRPSLFMSLDRQFGGFSMDLLSSAANAQVGHDGRAIPFFLRYACPGSAGTNVFAQAIPVHSTTYANPPFVLIGPLLSYLRSQHSYTVMVLPQWDMGRTGQYWWPLVLEAATEWHLLARAFTPSPFERRNYLGVFVPLPPAPYSLWAVLLEFRFM
jgi:hypothetical protein